MAKAPRNSASHLRPSWQGLACEDYVALDEPPEMDGVLHIQLDELTAWVKPDVTMDTLVRLTMKEGLIPQVVASSKNTTVWEAFYNEACGSSSFQYGTFDCTVLSVQVLPIKLNVSDAADQQFKYTDSLHGLVSINLFKIPLIKAGRYVEMTYWAVKDVLGATARMMPTGPKTLLRGEPAVDGFTDFLDTVMYGKASGVVVTGKFMPKDKHYRNPSGKRRPFGKRNPFVQHAKSIILNELQPPSIAYVERVPLMDYLFRYDDHSVSKNLDSGMVNDILPAGWLGEYVSGHWQTCHSPVSIVPVKPHSTFKRRRIHNRPLLYGDLYKIQTVTCGSQEIKSLRIFGRLCSLKRTVVRMASRFLNKLQCNSACPM